MSQYVRIKAGMPVPKDFQASDGTPLVIDTTSGIGYYLLNNKVFPLIGGTVIGPAFSSGFSNGFG